MTKYNMTIWNHDAQTTVLQEKGPDNFYIPLSYATTDVLRSLGEAINDVLNAPAENPSGSGKPTPGALPSPATLN
jgi:hypothetical protein